MMKKKMMQSKSIGFATRHNMNRFHLEILRRIDRFHLS